MILLHVAVHSRRRVYVAVCRHRHRSLSLFLRRRIPSINSITKHSSFIQHSQAGRSKEFHYRRSIRVDKRMDEGQDGGCEFFLNFCFEIVHIGAKVTNAVHHQPHPQKTRLKTDQFCHNFGGVFETIKPHPDCSHEHSTHSGTTNLPLPSPNYQKSNNLELY